MCSGLDNKCISLSMFLDVVMEITLQQGDGEGNPTIVVIAASFGLRPFSPES